MLKTAWRRLVVLGCLALSACAAPDVAPVSATLEGDSARPAQAEWLRTELYLALGPLEAAADPAVQARWRQFVDEEITPRFSDGLTVLDAYGQWYDRPKAILERLNSRVIVILHPADERSMRKIDEIRVAWKRRTGHRSVLRVSQSVSVSF